MQESEFNFKVKVYMKGKYVKFSIYDIRFYVPIFYWEHYGLIYALASVLFLLIKFFFFFMFYYIHLK